jgi:hypothetical protein
MKTLLTIYFALNICSMIWLISIAFKTKNVNPLKTTLAMIFALLVGFIYIILDYVVYMIVNGKIHKKAIRFFEKIPFRLKGIYLYLNDYVSNWEGLQRSSTRYNQSMPIQEERTLKIQSTYNPRK